MSTSLRQSKHDRELMGSGRPKKIDCGGSAVITRQYSRGAIVRSQSRRTTSLWANFLTTKNQSPAQPRKACSEQYKELMHRNNASAMRQPTRESSRCQYPHIAVWLFHDNIKRQPLAFTPYLIPVGGLAQSLARHEGVIQTAHALPHVWANA